MDAWRLNSKCIHTRVNFFPAGKTKGGRRGKDAPPNNATTEALEADVARICNGDDDGVPCPSRQECLDYGLSIGESWGVWGGKTAIEMRQLRKRLKKAS